MSNDASKITKQKVPVILYEENKHGKTNVIPYIDVGVDEVMPRVIFIQEYRDTGETEPDGEGGKAQIVDMIMHKYVDMEYLQKLLDKKTNDKIRSVLGLKSLKEARKEGQKILDNVSLNANRNKDELLYNNEKRAERIFSLGENLKTKLQDTLNTSNKEEN